MEFMHISSANIFWRKNAASAFGVAAIFFVAALSGASVAFWGVSAALLIGALLGGVTSFFIPIRYLVVLTIVTAFLVMGQLIYFARIEKAAWFPFLLGLLLLVRLPGDLMSRSLNNPLQASFKPHTPSVLVALIVIYFSTIAASSLISRTGLLQVFVSGKEYFFIWGLFFVIAAGLISIKQLESIWHFLPWLLPLQLPLVLYQRFIIAPRRAIQHLGAEWDAVVGAFGGNPDGGGASGAMSIFIVFAMAMVFAQWRQGSIKKTYALIILSSGLATLVLAEVKFAVLLLPIALAIVLWNEFGARPVRAIIMFAGAIFITFLVLFSYKAQYSNDAIEQSNNGYFDQLVSSTTDSQFINYRTGEIGRYSAITFWADQQASVVTAAIGYGMGSSRKGDMVTGAEAQRWSFNIARSSLAILLWETGLIGTITFILLLTVAFFSSQKLAKNLNISAQEQIILRSCGAGLAMLILELPYNTDIFYSSQIQIILMLMLGQITMSWGKLKSIAGENI